MITVTRPIDPPAPPLPTLPRILHAMQRVLFPQSAIVGFRSRTGLIRSTDDEPSLCACAAPFPLHCFFCLFNSQCHLFKQTLLLYVRTRNEGKCGSNYGPAEWLTDPVPI